MAKGQDGFLVVAAATTQELIAALAPLTGEQVFPGQGKILPCVIQGRKVLALSTGIGPINAGIALGRLLGERNHQVAGVLNVGIAGTFDPEVLPLGQAAVASEEIWPEFGLIGPEGIDPKAVGIAQARNADGLIWDRIPLRPQKAAVTLELTLEPAWPQVPFLTVAGATGTVDRAGYLTAQYRPGLENMEGFAMALACLHVGIPFLELRTVSNFVGRRDGWQIKEAMKHLGQAVAMAFGLVDAGKPGGLGR